MSRRLFVAEVLFIAAPLSLAFAWLGVGMLVPALFVRPWGTSAIVGLVALVASAALVSAWVLVLTFLRGGARALRERGFSWWLLPAVGTLILGAAVASVLLPAAPEYSREWEFRELLEVFALGLPLLLPFAHLAAERRFRAVGL